MKPTFTAILMLTIFSIIGCDGDIKNISLHFPLSNNQGEFSSSGECANVVAKLQAISKIVNASCNYLFNEEEKTKRPEYRKYVLCLRHDITKAENNSQARNIIESCAKNFPSIDANTLASNLIQYSFPTPEQQAINESNERKDEEARREQEKEYQAKLAEIQREADRNLLEMEVNRPRTCFSNGNSMTCY